MNDQDGGTREIAESQPTQRLTDVAPPQQIEVMAAAWQGPLPPPHELRQYNEIVPGAADRIIEMAEKQSDHRIQMEKTVIGGDSKRSYIGIFAAFILSAMAIGGGIYLIANDHDWAGSILIGLDMIGLASVFIYGASTRRRAERILKDSAVRDDGEV